MFTDIPINKTRFIIAFVTILVFGLLAGCAVADIPTLNQTSPEESAPVQSEGTEEDQIGVFENEETFILVEEVIILLLFIASLVGIVARRFRVPYTLGLVVIGLLITLLPQVDITIQPTLIFALLIPPIVFEGAFHLNLNQLEKGHCTNPHLRNTWRDINHVGRWCSG